MGWAFRGERTERKSGEGKAKLEHEPDQSHKLVKLCPPHITI